MKFLSMLLLFTAIANFSRAAIFTNSAAADAFVRSKAPTLNDGAAGALSVSGINATNSSGVSNGAFDTFIRFKTASMVTNFDSLFGRNNWVISSAQLQLMEVGAPMQTIFNRGKGAFEIRWIANDSWIEGTGTPMIPTTDGVAYNNEPTLLSSNTDVSLGTFTNVGTDGTLTCSLALPGAFVSDLRNGNEVGFYFTAIDPGMGFTFDSRSFGTVSARPYLLVSAMPQPGITDISLSGPNVIITATNGVSGRTHYVLSSTNLMLPLDQWTAIATMLLTGNGDFSVVLTNVANNAPSLPHFFILQAH